MMYLATKLMYIEEIPSTLFVNKINLNQLNTYYDPTPSKI